MQTAFLQFLSVNILGSPPGNEVEPGNKTIDFLSLSRLFPGLFPGLILDVKVLDWTTVEESQS